MLRTKLLSPKGEGFDSQRGIIKNRQNPKVLAAMKKSSSLWLICPSISLFSDGGDRSNKINSSADHTPELSLAKAALII